MLKLSRSEIKRLAAEYPVGDPFGGPAYGQKNDPVSATIGAAVIGGGASLIGSSSAADAQENAANTASNTQLQLFDKQAAQSQPYRDVGVQGLNTLARYLGLNPATTGTTAQPGVNSNIGPIPTNALLNYLNAINALSNASVSDSDNRGLDIAAAQRNVASTLQALQGQSLTTNPVATATQTPVNTFDGTTGELLKDFTLADFQADPGYQFRLSEGEKGINRAAAARGLFNSGPGYKNLLRFNQGLASDEFTNAFNRNRLSKTDKFNRLASIAGIGQTSTEQLGNQSSVLGQSLANNITGAGNARASGYVGGANAITGAINNYQQQNLLNRLLQKADPAVASNANYVPYSQYSSFNDAFDNPGNYG